MTYTNANPVLIELYGLMLKQRGSAYMWNDDHSGLDYLKPGEYGVEVCWRCYVDYIKLVPNE